MACADFDAVPHASVRGQIDAIEDLMKTYVQYPPRKQQSESYSAPITLQQYERLQNVRDSLAKEDINIPLPTGN